MFLTYVPDLSVFGCLVVELKAVSQLLPEHEAQLINYMRITKQPVGYLINFGHKDTLEWRRFIFSDLIPSETANLRESPRFTAMSPYPPILAR